MNPPRLHQQFVFHFGAMGSRGGITRTVRQICPLVFLSKERPNAEQIAERFGFSPANVSMGTLVRLPHVGTKVKHFARETGRIIPPGLGPVRTGTPSKATQD